LKRDDINHYIYDFFLGGVGESKRFVAYMLRRMARHLEGWISIFFFFPCNTEFEFAGKGLYLKSSCIASIGSFPPLFFSLFADGEACNIGWAMKSMCCSMIAQIIWRKGRVRRI